MKSKIARQALTKMLIALLIIEALVLILGVHTIYTQPTSATKIIVKHSD